MMIITVIVIVTSIIVPILITTRLSWMRMTYGGFYFVCVIELDCDVVFATANLPTKSLDFRGFDSSRLLILRGGNYHVRRI